jgi:hypothetical protein
MSNKSKLSLKVETILSLSSLDQVVGGAQAAEGRLGLAKLAGQGIDGRPDISRSVRPTEQCIGSCFCPPSPANPQV